MNDVFMTDRRSRSSNCNSNTALLGSTDISQIGQTVTGAIANIASSHKEGNWVSIGTVRGVSPVTYDFDPDDYYAIQLFSTQYEGPGTYIETSAFNLIADNRSGSNKIYVGAFYYQSDATNRVYASADFNLDRKTVDMYNSRANDECILIAKTH